MTPQSGARSPLHAAPIEDQGLRSAARASPSACSRGPRRGQGGPWRRGNWLRRQRGALVGVKLPPGARSVSHAVPKEDRGMPVLRGPSAGDSEDCPSRRRRGAVLARTSAVAVAQVRKQH